MGVSTDPEKWQDKGEYAYPIDQVVGMAQEAIAAIKGSLMASFKNTIENSPNYSRYASEGENQPDKILREIQKVVIHLDQVEIDLADVLYRYRKETPDPVLVELAQKWSKK